MELTRFAAPQMSNDGHVVIASSNTEEGIYSYHLTKNKWYLIWKYPLGFEPLRHTILVDNDDSKIYIYNTAPSAYDCFYEIDIKGKSHICYRGTIHGLPQGLGNETGGCALLTKVHNTIHAVGGYSNCHHSIWYTTHDTPLNISMFKQYPIMDRSQKMVTSLYGHALVPIERRNQLVILGGNSSMMFGGHLKDIWVCDVQNQTWQKLKDVTMPYKMFNFGYVVTDDKLFGHKLICFGGKTNFGVINEIWILDLSDWKWTKSDIRCPKIGMFHAIKTQFNEVHLFEINRSGHWKMKLAEIIPISEKSMDLNIISSLKANLIQEKKKFRVLHQKNEIDNKQKMNMEQALKQSKHQNMILTKQNDKMKDELRRLQAAYDELNGRYVEQEVQLMKRDDEYKEIHEKYQVLLQKEKRKILDDASSKYKNWSYKDIVYWISYLDAGKFEKYEQVFTENMRKENIKGYHLTDLDKHDIHRLGCTDYADKKALLNHFQSLLRK
eukprot:49881_1